MEKNISFISKKEGINSHNVVRDYFLGIIASVSNEVNSTLATREKPKPIIIGGTALRKAYFLSYPRYTPDIDFEGQMIFFERNNLSVLRNYEKNLFSIADLVRQKIVHIYGNNHNFEPCVTQLKKPNDNLGVEFGTLKGDIFIPKFFKWQNIAIKMETATKKNTIFLPLENKPLLHNFNDQDKLNLASLSVPNIHNIVANKIYASLSRFANHSDEGGKISRMKDIFDIWYINKQIDLDKEIIKSIFYQRLAEEINHGVDITSVLIDIQKIINSPDKYFNNIFYIISKYVKSVENASSSDKMKRMTKGIVKNFIFPDAKELTENFKDYLWSL